MINRENLAAALDKVRQSSPLVHCITNYVAMNFNANALLAIGASPVMAHAKEEMADMTAIASSLVLNIGTLDEQWVEGIFAAGSSMLSLGKPIIFDPVGSGATPYRTAICKRIIEECRPTIIRGNGSEIMSLVDTEVLSKGVDSSVSSDLALEAAKILSKSSGAVVVISGQRDYITDGERVETITNGSTMMTAVTAMGCTATVVVAAFAAVCDSPFDAALYAMALMGVAGERAAAVSSAPATLQLNFLDTLYTITGEELSQSVTQCQ
ncbi:MAG: hydroxyethylthiazole kinase [Rikenellaceae bacterium]